MSDRWDALAAGFATLARLHLSPPAAEQLAALVGMIDDWPLPDTAEAQQGLERVRRSAATGETAEIIRRDHDLLYGVTATAKVPPYESVHRGIDGLVFDTQTLEVRRAYEALGLQAPNLNREPDDHIGLELDFMAQVFLRALDDVAASRDPTATLAAGRAFLDDHLCAWGPPMLDAVAERAATEFMAGVALLSLGALRSANDVLG